ncbi:MAG TPA: Gfo/Idh/MocA family oxidoreductase, partial [Armatimonadota bacterium]
MALRIGMVGAGRSALEQARIISQFPDVEITAVAEPQRTPRDSFARLFEARLAVSDHRRLASDASVDIVSICSPPATHSAIAIDALNEKKHVICRPPIAVTVQQADEMIAAAKENDRKLLIAMPHKYNPVNQEAARIIEADEIGYPFMAQAFFVENNYTRLNDWHDWKGTWESGGGGILMEHGPDMIDLLRFLFGEVDAVSSICTRFAVKASNKAEDTCLMDLEFLSEISVQLVLTGAAQFSAWPETYSGCAVGIHIFGVDGSMVINTVTPRLVLSTRKNRRRILEPHDIPTDLPTNMHRDLLDSIVEDRDPLASAEDAR